MDDEALAKIISEARRLRKRKASFASTDDDSEEAPGPRGRQHNRKRRILMASDDADLVFAANAVKEKQLQPNEKWNDESIRFACLLINSQADENHCHCVGPQELQWMLTEASKTRTGRFRLGARVPSRSRYLLLPCHVNGDHWMLVIHDKVKNKLYLVNSAIGSTSALPEPYDLLPAGLGVSSTVEILPSVQQTDDYSCGLFVTANMRIIARSGWEATDSSLLSAEVTGIRAWLAENRTRVLVQQRPSSDERNSNAIEVVEELNNHENDIIDESDNDEHDDDEVKNDIIDESDNDEHDDDEMKVDIIDESGNDEHDDDEMKVDKEQESSSSSA
jgi:hypothetical protein